MSEFQKKSDENSEKEDSTFVSDILARLGKEVRLIHADFQDKFRRDFNLTDEWDTIQTVPDADKAAHAQDTANYAASICAIVFLYRAFSCRFLLPDSGEATAILLIAAGADDGNLAPEQADLYEILKSREFRQDDIFRSFVADNRTPGQFLDIAENFANSVNDGFDDYCEYAIDSFFPIGLDNFFNNCIGPDGKKEYFRHVVQEMTGAILREISDMRKGYAEKELERAAHAVAEKIEKAQETVSTQVAVKVQKRNLR